jgi:hypothetical protein
MLSHMPNFKLSSNKKGLSLLNFDLPDNMNVNIASKHLKCMYVTWKLLQLNNLQQLKITVYSAAYTANCIRY